MCILITVNVILHQISGFNSSCPGDIIIHRCFVESNSKDFFLTWHITLPGNESVNITYSNNESLNTTVLLHINPEITSFLIDFIPGLLIESIITLTVPDSGSVLVNGTVLDCITTESVASAIVLSNSPPST